MTRLANILFFAVLTILSFSLWAAFALLVVNPYLQDELPGYRIGRICIWEFIALGVAVLISLSLIKKWGWPLIDSSARGKYLSVNINYIYLFLGYFMLGLVFGIWQFWLFSLRF